MSFKNYVLYNHDFDCYVHVDKARDQMITFIMLSPVLSIPKMINRPSKSFDYFGVCFVSIALIYSAHMDR